MSRIPTDGRRSQKTLPVRQSVFDHLRTEILRGGFGDGERLVENDIARLLHVSRTPVREAFRKLENEGLVAYSKGRGVTVTKFSKQDIDDLYDIRSALEGLAARLAAERMSARDLQQLKKLLQDISELYKAGDYRRAVELHTVFNKIVYRSSGNRRLFDLARRFHEYTEKSQLKSMALPGRFEEIQEEHYRIVVALERRDPKLAEEAVRVHLQHARAAYLKSLETWWFQA